jgi:hypothetical protein
MTPTPTASNCSTGSPTGIPGLDLDQHEIKWTALDDGHQALLLDGGGFDCGTGIFFCNAGNDLHAVGSLAPIVGGYVGCIVIRPDKTRVLARAVPDPLAQHKPD